MSSAGISFGFREPQCGCVELTCPVEHPWLQDEMLSRIADHDGSDLFQAVREANDRLSRLQEQGAPQSLTYEVRSQLADTVRAYFDDLLTTRDLRFGTSAQFSGRAVLIPGPDLQIDQLGLSEELAWQLFSPSVSRILGNAEAVRRRDTEARVALEKTMAESWVILNRAPSVTATALLAFHPVLSPERAIRLHPIVCGFMDADFDGDQAAVHLPVTKAAQQQAGEKLTIAGHLARDSALIEMVCPGKDALFGIACLSLPPHGRRSIGKTVDIDLIPSNGIVTRRAVIKALRSVLVERGIPAALETAQRLWHLGFKASRAEGGSIGPFVGSAIALPPAPVGDDEDQWQAYQQEVEAVVALWRAYDDEDFGAVSLLCHSGARANTHQLAQLIAPRGAIRDVCGQIVHIRNSWQSGLSSNEALASVVGARRGLFDMLERLDELGRGQEIRERPDGYGVMARARRAKRPGVVFARAAAAGELDPVTDEYARLFVGISD